MDTVLSIPAAFLIGLLGSVHCVGMCGGIVGAMTSSLATGIQASRWRFAAALLAYNSGRIASYTCAGVLLGLLGQQVSNFGWLASYPVGRIIGGLFMILFGLYLAGWGSALLVLEKGGARLWRRIEPLGRRFVPVRSSAQAFMLGLVWGWLPCGMVYSVLALALVSGSILYGGLTMLVFGLGTLPLLLGMGYALGSLGTVLRGRPVRVLAGATVILFGLYTLFILPGGHDHAAHGHSSHPHQSP